MFTYCTERLHLSEAAAFVTGECLRVDGGAPLFSAVMPSIPLQRQSAFRGFHREVIPEALRDGDEPEPGP